MFDSTLIGLEPLVAPSRSSVVKWRITRHWMTCKGQQWISAEDANRGYEQGIGIRG
jgi:hypothetical protein